MVYPRETVKLIWMPSFRAYAVRLGARLIGFVACGDGRLPFRADVKVNYL